MPLKSLLLLFVGAGVGSLAVGLTQRSTAEAPLAFAKEDPAFRSLDANLYQQASAEYRACCIQAYNLAERRLAEKMTGDPAYPKPQAVILDLDETVFDNSGFQAMSARSGLNFDMRLWDIWQEKNADDVGLVPGAKEFLAFAKAKGVAICFITNRDEKYRAGCKAVLERHGLSVPDDQLLLAGKTSDKTERRVAIAGKFTVLMLIGDNLRDFDDVFRYEKGVDKKPVPEAIVAIAARDKLVDDNKAKFGGDWIILPNPMYGEWQKPFGRGAVDLEFLRPVRKQKD
jgi:5'-nucleotidase (lipoprotein e(P4) family)